MKYKTTVNILFTSYLLIYFLSRLYPELLGIRHTIILGLILSVITLPKIKKEDRRILILILVLGIFSFFNTALRPSYGNFSYSILMFIFPGFIIAVNRRYINPKWILFLFYAYFIYLIIHEFILHIDFNILFPAASRNFVGWISIFLCILYYFISINNGSKYSLIPSVFNLFNAILLEGRSGIIVSSLLLVAVIYELHLKKISAKNIALISIFCLLSLWAFYNFDFFFEDKFTYFENKGLENTERDYIWKAYVNSIEREPIKLLIGESPYTRIEFDLFNNNLHNSFLTGHSYFGILFIITILYTIYLVISNLKNNFLVSSLTLLLLLRAFTDSVLFIQPFDFLFYATINYLVLAIKKQ